MTSPPLCEQEDDSLLLERIADRYRVTCQKCGVTSGWLPMPAHKVAPQETRDRMVGTRIWPNGEEPGGAA